MSRTGPDYAPKREERRSGGGLDVEKKTSNGARRPGRYMARFEEERGGKDGVSRSKRKPTGGSGMKSCLVEDKPEGKKGGVCEAAREAKKRYQPPESHQKDRP